MANQTRPAQLRASLMLLVVTLVFSFVFYMLISAPASAIHYNKSIYYFYITEILSVLLSGIFLYNIYRGHSCARIVWTILFTYLFWSSLKITFDYEKYPVFLAFIRTIFESMKIFAFVLLWHPATTRWFKAMNAARLNLSKETKVENSESKKDDPAVSIPKTVYNGISYNKLLKILRAGRALYVLIVIFTMTNITAVYGNAFYSINKYPMSDIHNLLFNSDMTIALHLLIILIFSLGYLIIEYLFDKKLQAYPHEFIDRSYSPQSTLFLSFLYIFFLFNLNNWVFVAFFYLTAHLNINKPGKMHLCLLLLINFAIVYYVFKYLVKKIENKKTWRNFWIIAVCLSPVMFALANALTFIIPRGISIFAKPILSILMNIKLFFM